MERDANKFCVNEFDRILIEQGVSLIPRVPGTKEPPAGFRYSERWDGKKIATLEEMVLWGVHDRAAICGVNHLVVFDFDSDVAYYTFWDQKLAHQLFLDTLVVRTARGFQVWFFDYSLELKKFVNVVDGKPTIAMEIFLQKHLAAVPNNTHPSGKKYELMGSYTIARKDGIVEKAIERLRSLHWVGSIYTAAHQAPGSEDQSRKVNELTGEIDDVEDALDLLVPFWIEARSYYLRSRFMLALSGYLIRRGVKKDSAVSFVVALTERANDRKSTSKAVYRMKSLYDNSGRVKALQGLPSLVQIMKQIKMENGTIAINN